jgi:hypothetical protein
MNDLAPHYRTATITPGTGTPNSGQTGGTATVTAVSTTPTDTGSTLGTETAVTTPEPPQRAAKTSDLVASDSFDFTSSYTVKVDIQLSKTAPKYLNICQESTGLNNSVEVDYGSCLLQMALEVGRFEGDITVTNDITKLVIAIWDFTGSNSEYRF